VKPASAVSTVVDLMQQKTAELRVVEVIGASAVPSIAQLRWQAMETGAFIHFGPSSFMERELDDGSLPLSAFNPDRLDTDQWVSVAQSMGAQYIVLTAKHTGGFCLWQTHTSDYGVRNTPWRQGRGDVMADLAESCRKAGMKLGFYLCPRDDHMHARDTGLADDPSRQAEYDAYYRAQLQELLTCYGEIVEVWFDGSTRTRVDDLVAKHAPDAVVFGSPHNTIRWVGNEEGIAPDPCWHAVSESDACTGQARARHGTPDGDVWLPVEVDARMRRDWFYSPSNAHTLKSVDHLLSIYYQSVGRGAVLLLNLNPDSSGLIPEVDARRAAEFGQSVRNRFGKPIASTQGIGPTLDLLLGSRRTVDHVVLQEDISQGQRVRDFVLEVPHGSSWKAVFRGTAIGYKYIASFDPVSAEVVRLRITNSVGVPTIQRFDTFSVGSSPSALLPAPVRECEQIGWWNSSEFRLEWNAFSRDLSEYVTAPGEYELRFDSLRDKAWPHIRQASVWVDGQIIPGATPGLQRGSVVFRLNNVPISSVRVSLDLAAGSTEPTEGPLHLIRHT